MLEVSFIILSIAFLLLAGVMVVLLYRIWKVMERFSPVIEQLNQSLPAILQNIQDTTLNAKQTSSYIHFQAERLSLLLNQLRNWSDVIALTRGLKLKFFSKGTKGANTVALAKGITAFVQTLFTQRNNKIR